MKKNAVFHRSHFYFYTVKYNFLNFYESYLELQTFYYCNHPTCKINVFLVVHSCYLWQFRVAWLFTVTVIIWSIKKVVDMKLTSKAKNDRTSLQCHKAEVIGKSPGRASKCWTTIYWLWVLLLLAYPTKECRGGCSLFCTTHKNQWPYITTVRRLKNKAR